MNALALSLSLLFGAVKTSPPAYDPVATALAIELALAELHQRPAALRTAPGRGVGEPATSPANVPQEGPVRAAAGGANPSGVVWGYYREQHCDGHGHCTLGPVKYGPLGAATMKPLTNSQGTTH